MVTVKTILLVEDDQVASTAYQSRLEREGFHVETAPDGLAALRTLSKRTVDLVILDLILPKLDGASVLKQMRLTPRLQNVPVIVLSNAASPELDEDALLTGPTRRLHKTDCPFSLLLQTIAELVTITASQATPPEPAAAGGTVPASGNGQPKPDGDVTALSGGSPERSGLLQAVLQKIPEIREHCCAYIRAPASPASLPHLAELHQSANWVRTNADDLECPRIAMLARALEALLSEIKVKPSVITPSILQTIAQAVDCLALLLKSDEVDLARPLTHAKVLVVDDDPVCSMANVKSLQRANLDAEGINDPVAALQKLQTTAVDAVLLDINMPGITGFELCEKLRHLPGCKTIPVIFITGYSNFDNRKQSVLSGGQDFITKPIFPLELALKTTLHLLKAQLQHPSRHNVTPEPGSAGIQITGLPVVEKAEPPLLRVDGSRSAQSEPAIPNRSATTQLIEARAETSAALATNAKAAASPGTAGSATMESPEAITPQPISSTPNESRTSAEPQNLKPAVLPATSAPGEEKPACSSRAETEPAGRPDERFELQIKLAAEQQTAAKLRQAFMALQRKLCENADALDKARGELQRQTFGLTESTAAAQQAQNALREKESLCSRQEQELAGLRTGRDELQARLAAVEKAATRGEHDFEVFRKQARHEATLLAKARTDLQEQTARFNTASAAAEQARKALQEKEARCSQLQQELTGLRESATASAQARTTLPPPSGSLEAATAATARQAEKTLQQNQARCQELEQEVAALQAGRSELQARLEAAQQRVGELERNYRALDEMLDESEDASAEARNDLQQALEKLRVLTAEADQAQQQFKGSEARRNELEQALAGAVAGRSELEGKLAREQEASARLRQEFEALQKHQQDNNTALTQVRADLQQQLNVTTTALDQTRTKLQQQNTEQARRESEYRNLVTANETLNLELSRLREQVESRKAYPVPDAPAEARAQVFQLTAPGASAVLLVGDFTGWQKEPVPMKPGVDGVWSATVKLLPGAYLYMFIVDGKWSEDPACAQRVLNGFGGQNMVRHVV